MPYLDPKTGKTKYTLEEKQRWHNDQAKKGAKRISKKTGKEVALSDFERGRHKAQADAIHSKRKNYAIRMAKEESGKKN